MADKNNTSFGEKRASWAEQGVNRELPGTSGLCMQQQKGWREVSRSSRCLHGEILMADRAAVGPSFAN